MFAIIVASILFSTLLSVRFFESSQVEMNGKYRSIKFASQRQNDVDSSKIVKVEPRKQDNAKQQEKYIKKENLNEPEAQKKVETSPHIPREDIVVETKSKKVVKNVPKKTKPQPMQRKEVPKKVVKPKIAPVVPKEIVKKAAETTIEAAVPVIVANPSKKRSKSKNSNPLTAGLKKPKTSSVKKVSIVKPLSPRKEVENPIEDDYDNDPSTFRGKLIPEESDFSDYDVDPSFRGKQDQGEVKETAFRELLE